MFEIFHDEPWRNENKCGELWRAVANYSKTWRNLTRFRHGSLQFMNVRELSHKKQIMNCHSSIKIHTVKTR
jgi:hypothetical protein